MIESFRGMADDARATHANLRSLSPPPHVQAWHNEYLILLEEMASSVDLLVEAYFAGDAAAIDRASERIDAATEREDELAAQFDERRFD